MGLYDVIDEITQRQVLKTESGDNRIWGVMVGIVAKNFDPNSSVGGGSQSGADAMDGRVCVTIPTRDKDANELKWARVAMPSSGSKWGHYFLPEVGDQVLLAFEGGNIEKPYVIGCIPKVNDKFLKKSVDKDNQYKRIVTRHGTSIIFEDNSGNDDGEKDKLTLETAGKKLQILMDNENEKIRIGDKAKEDFIEMYTKEGSGTLQVKIKSKITFQVGDKITVTMNGESGAVSIKADSILLEGANGVKSKSDSAVKMEAPQVSANASSALKLESAGTATVSGSTVSVG
jgi:uncharacterized protein involved in type VI secretion and phage assembly